MMYRTLIRGTLEQLTPVTLGGTGAEPMGPDIQCARDGQGRLTIPGTTLAGALIQTAARIDPTVFNRPAGMSSANDPLNRLTGKQLRPPAGNQTFVQSAVQFWPAHLLEPSPAMEWRTGVGIRQKTGAAAAEQKALFEVETIPAGRLWRWGLEIDTFRLQRTLDDRRAAELDDLLLAALREWAAGRCWLGANVARGQGWFRLLPEQTDVFRIPLTPAAVAAWPNNQAASFDAACRRLQKELELEPQQLAAADESQQPTEQNARWRYLTIEVSLPVGTAAADPSGYGLDFLATFGHRRPDAAERDLDQLVGGDKLDHLLSPDGADAQAFRKAYDPDAVLSHSHGGGRHPRPVLPGSGIRGALRHMVSRLRRSGVGGPASPVPDPNDSRREKLRDPRNPTTDSRNAVSRLFGIDIQSARLLVRDAHLVRGDYRMASLQHHAEDEFTAGVYGSGKFERTVLTDGEFRFQMVLEIDPGRPDELREFVGLLRPALELAAAGQLPLGAGKWRGCGWLPWRFTEVTWAASGQPASYHQQATDGGTLDIAAVLDEIVEGQS